VLHVLDGERLMRLVENGCFHGPLLRLVGRSEDCGNERPPQYVKQKLNWLVFSCTSVR
jgi:hypothetical protein